MANCSQDSTTPSTHELLLPSGALGKDLPECLHSYFIFFQQKMVKLTSRQTRTAATNRPQPFLHRSRREIALESETGSLAVAPVTLERRGGRTGSVRRQCWKLPFLEGMRALPLLPHSDGLELVIKATGSPDLTTWQTMQVWLCLPTLIREDNY